MKYWILLTSRVVARVGLGVVLLTWFFSHSLSVDFGVRIGRAAIGVQTIISGGTISFVPVARPGPRWWYRWNARPDHALVISSFNETWPVQHQSIPGVEYREATKVPGYMLHFDHWLLCLTLLIATTLTSRPWQKPPASAPEPATE